MQASKIVVLADHRDRWLVPLMLFMSEAHVVEVYRRLRTPRQVVKLLRHCASDEFVGLVVSANLMSSEIAVLCHDIDMTLIVVGGGGLVATDQHLITLTADASPHEIVDTLMLHCLDGSGGRQTDDESTTGDTPWPLGDLVVFSSPPGGPGNTVAAMNLAAAWNSQAANLGTKPCLLLDMSMENPTVALWQGISLPHKTVLDLFVSQTPQSQRVEDCTIRNNIAVSRKGVRRSRLDFVPGTRQLWHQVSPATVGECIQNLRREYVVICDLDSGRGRVNPTVRSLLMGDATACVHVFRTDPVNMAVFRDWLYEQSPTGADVYAIANMYQPGKRHMAEIYDLAARYFNSQLSIAHFVTAEPEAMCALRESQAFKGSLFRAMNELAQSVVSESAMKQALTREVLS